MPQLIFANNGDKYEPHRMTREWITHLLLLQKKFNIEILLKMESKVEYSQEILHPMMFI